MIHEEELNIDGQDSIKGTQEESQVNRIESHVSDLSNIAAPGDTNEEFLNKLLQASPEQLIPWEECHLPSKGFYYGWADGIVQVKAMGQVAEQILATQRLAQDGQSIEYLFRECCRFPGDFDPVDLILGDRTFLLYYLRGITHGNIYEFAITCTNPDCGSVSTHSYDLNELAQTILWADKSWGPEPFKVDLPYLSKATGREVWVGVRFLRTGDSYEMLARRKVKKKAIRPGGARNRPRGAVVPGRQTLDDTINDNMEKIIVSVMGVTDPFAIRNFIPMMHSQDTATIREWLREHTPGIDTTIEVDCPDCSNTFVVELPITESFFRPAKSAGVRKRI